MLNKEFWVLSPEIAVVIQGPGSVYNDCISGFAFIIFKPLYIQVLIYFRKLICCWGNNITALQYQPCDF